ncbi:unnamed protein product [Paramecium sonneborni]|uniref:Uncharacterized protein n=1 Tax=Paramecium sonneborni TaxID=65129 RepID=A0A8S1MM25_9CILI|nr:unnamed protein product [Paramecium sonneborni]
MKILNQNQLQEASETICKIHSQGLIAFDQTYQIRQNINKFWSMFSRENKQKQSE